MFSAILPYLFSSLILLALIEQISYLLKKRHLPGPTFVLPYLGGAISVITNPTKFWDAQSAFSASLGYSANYIVGNFIIYIRDSNLSNLIFANVRPDAFKLIGHPFGKKLFGDHNLIYMFGQEHKDLRRRIAPNFTPRALSAYTNLQQIIILKHLKQWEELCSRDPTRPIPLRLLAREMNLETSHTVFVGPYLKPEDRARFREDYNLFNVGSMSLPFDLPGFAFRKAIRAVDRLVNTLADCARQCRTKMETGDEEPTCLVDFWMQDTLREIAAAKAAGDTQPSSHPDDNDIGGYLFDFLFAAQDASTSSLLWAVALLDANPEVLSRVRSEVESLWSPESEGLITTEQIGEMKYTQMVAREVIRYRPPATMVPHVAMREFRLTESYTVPKGTIVFPSVYDSSFQGFTEAERFDPERFSEMRAEDRVYKRNFLAFGAGPHQCVGQRYALNHLVLFIAMFCRLLDFKRHRTDGCDEIVYNPTISPKDGCRVTLSRRCAYPDLPSN